VGGPAEPGDLHPGERPAAVASVGHVDGAVVVALAGELDLYNAGDVRAALLACCDEQPERLIVDLEQVSFIDSTALGVLIEARSRLSNRRAFMLASPQIATRRALEVSGLDRHFDVYASRDDALAAQLP
jgi:anti-sigma B factor antagonist